MTRSPLRLGSGAVSGDQGSYGYDYQGRRVWRTVVGSWGSAQTHYVFDEAGHLIAEHNGATGAVLREYVWLDDTPVAMIDSTGASPVTYYIHTGQIEEPLVMTDAGQAKVWDAYVEPFGQAQVFGTPSAGLDLRLPGQFTEAETGALSQNGNRDYDPSLGRYIEADPLGIEAGQNVYGYVDGDPLSQMDPAGLTKVILFSLTEDSAMYRSALVDADDPTECIVYAHGNDHDITDQRNGKAEGRLVRWQNANAAAFNEFLNQKMGCKPSQRIVLKACDTGAPGRGGQKPFAQFLADARRTLVIAPNRSIWFGPGGPNPTPYGHKGGDVHNPMNQGDPGAYIQFIPRR